MQRSIIQPLSGAQDSSKSAFDFIGDSYYYNSNPQHDKFLKPIIEKPINQLLSDELFFLIRDFDRNIEYALPKNAIETGKEQPVQGTGFLNLSFYNQEQLYYQFIMLLRALGQRGKELVQNAQVDATDAENLIKMINVSATMSHSPAMQEFKTLLENSIKDSATPSLKTKR